ncbi:hypothetical protein RFI_37009 [Reticulomyxa filosa]|uniref:Uncharacterized protein n=1 Tax=Reticulomyxa filosa TaxID=46433 RepID=X6LIB1_RETFI|nr:hypothetical protein RFI_37009 [Reticulomyxa filosa]|eukprot:ETO00435.1 hypothetical protein RFI_37009 [Reticulomyxa filosa]
MIDERKLKVVDELIIFMDMRNLYFKLYCFFCNVIGKYFETYLQRTQNLFVDRLKSGSKQKQSEIQITAKLVSLFDRKVSYLTLAKFFLLKKFVFLCERCFFVIFFSAKIM